MNVLLSDEFWKPSKEWGETFYTLANNQVRVYHNDEFDVSKIDLLYYRYPLDINMADGYDDINGIPTVDVDPEFQGSSIVEILNMVIHQVAGVVTDQFRYQVFGNKAQAHT